MTAGIPGRLRGAAGADLLEWLERLASVEVRSLDISVPEGGALADTLRWLDVPEGAIPEIAAARPDRERHSEGWWILERCVATLARGVGREGEYPRFPELPPDLPGVPPHLYIHVFVATLPFALAYHRRHGISEQQSRAILGDLGRNVRVHDKRHGRVGLGVVSWIGLHFRGLIYDLGRLQFERSPMRWEVADALRQRGVDASPEELTLSAHIPDFKGPLTPDAVDEAIGRARTFFCRHFPSERYRYVVCHSWLLDPQLKRYLRPDSNILRFQDRFALAEGTSEADRSIVQFVFGPVPDDPADLSQRTSLERAVRAHLVAGRHWHVRSGWFALDG